MALKGQALADFLVELPQEDVDQGDTGLWVLNVDVTSSQIGVGVSLQLKAPTRAMIEQAIRLGFSASNKETEYKAILTGVDLVKSVSSD